MVSRIIIAIDGHSSTGKSTFAKSIAKKIGYLYIDTGAMYRAVTLLADRHGLISKNNTIDEPELENLLNTQGSAVIEFKVSKEDGESKTYLNGENVEKQIRSIGISNKVSHIASLPFVRKFVDEQLVAIGSKRGVVMDGRDIGTAVFPDAELKIFMTADPEIRAGRRLAELQAKGEDTTYEAVLQNIKERDYIDAHRAANPLSRASDAILLDNSHLSVEEQMEWVMKILESKGIC